MHVTSREFWTLVHGMIFGAGFLLLLSAGFFAIWNLHEQHLSEKGITRQLRHLAVGSWLIAILAWATVLLGTYVSYPWYRAKPPAGAHGLALVAYPKYLLVANEQTAEWHEFGMEWKEHIAWLVPILLTAVAFIVSRHGRQLVTDRLLRHAVLFLFTVAVFAAGIAGIFGALIDKAAPVQ